MKRQEYFNYIEEKLTHLSCRIKVRGRLNILDLNIHSESFFADMLNRLFNYQLENININKPNVEGIDLVDNKNQLVVQVSSICTKQKIENSLQKAFLEKYSGYRFIFIALTGDATQLRKQTYKNPYQMVFNPEQDIYDIASLLSNIKNIGDVNKMREFYIFIRKELGIDYDPVKCDSNLSIIINILAKEDFAEAGKHQYQTKSFEIERKIEYNNLISVYPIITEHSMYLGKLDKLYKEFDEQGVNKSRSIFFKIKQQYIIHSSKIANSHDLFFKVIDEIVDIVLNSKNYIEIPREELEMCVHIIVVDAFIRCQIFENPEGYNYAAT